MSEDLPEGWALATPDDLSQDTRHSLAIGPFGSSLKVSDYSEAGVPLVFVREIRADRFGGSGTRHVTATKARDLAAHTVRPGDLLVTKMGEPPGDTAVYPIDRPAAIITSDCIKLSPNPRATSARFLKHCLRAPDVRRQIAQRAMGVAQQKLSLERFKTIQLPLPPVAEQQRIVEVVEALLAEVKTARERLGKIPLILKRFRQSVLATACSGKLTEEWRKKAWIEPLADTLRRVRFEQSRSGRAATDATVPGRCILALGDPGTRCPSSWRWIPLTDVARLESGHTPTRKHPEYWNGRIPWVGLQDAREHNGGRILQTRQHVTEDGLANSAARLLPSETICLSRTASVGYVVILGRPMATSQDFVNWVCSEALDPEFLMFALLAEGESIKNFGRGTTHTTIYFPEVKALHICLPPLAEQREIVRRIRATLPLADSIGHRVAVASARADALTQSILAKAFRGELVPTEAELARADGRDYESAEALLSRIHGERAATARPSKGQRGGAWRAGARS